MNARMQLALCAVAAVVLPGATAAAEAPDTLALGLNQTVDIALASNLGLHGARLDTHIQRAAVAVQDQRFAPVLVGSAGHQAELAPSVSALEAVSRSRTSGQSLTLGLAKDLSTGGSLAIELRNRRSSSNAAYYTIDPVYSSALEAVLRQPLFRGRGRIHSADRDLARMDLAGARVQLAALARQVRAEAALAYWELHAASSRLELARQLRDGAARVLHTVTLRAAMGADRRASILAAEVGVARREEDIVLADGMVRTAVDRLRAVCGLDRDPVALAMHIALTDTPRVEGFEADLDAGIARALQLDSGHQQALLRSAQLDLHLAVARDRARPELNLEARAGLQGTGADYSSNVERLTEADGRFWGSSLSLHMPLGRSAPQAQYEQRRLEKQRHEIDLDELRLQLAQQVRAQHRQVQLDRRRIEAARASAHLAQQSLDEQEARLALGLATVREVLDAQDDLAAARASLVRAVVDHAQALIGWQRLTGD